MELFCKMLTYLGDKVMQPLISVIIPVYNTQEYIERSVESVLSNTYRNLEVICVDDGSTDDSLQLLTMLAEKDTRVKVISQENAGPSAARNRALDMAAGEYITFVDSDDWISPFFFEIMMTVRDAYDAQLVSCGHEIVNHYEDPAGQGEQAEAQITAVTVQRALEDKELRGRIWGKIYKRELLENVRFKKHLILGEDTIFNLSIYCGRPNMEIIVTNAVLYYYFQRETSIVHSLSFREFFYLGVEYIHFAAEIPEGVEKNILLLVGFRVVLAARYLSMYDEDAKSFQKSCNMHLQNCLREMKASRGFSKGKIVECIFFKTFPIAYRTFRIATDRTLIQWEKNQRELRRKRNKEGLN